MFSVVYLWMVLTQQTTRFEQGIQNSSFYFLFLAATIVEKCEVYEECDTPALGTCTALYSFEGGSEGTMAMGEGDEMILLEKDEGDGWTRVRHVASAREGFVPTSYLHCKWYPE